MVVCAYVIQCQKFHLKLVCLLIRLWGLTWAVPMQILPVNIKSLAGSVATLANWLTSWAITMTANLLLSWSSGGSLSLSHAHRHMHTLAHVHTHHMLMRLCMHTCMHKHNARAHAHAHNNKDMDMQACTHARSHNGHAHLWTCFFLWCEFPFWTGTFTFYTFVSAFTLVFVIIWVPETKGRTLEEIQWSFRWESSEVVGFWDISESDGYLSDILFILTCKWQLKIQIMFGFTITAKSWLALDSISSTSYEPFAFLL